MFENQLNECITIFEGNGIFLANGMTEQEIQVAESCYNIEFPTEYRKFISICLPLYDENYTDWRNTSEKYVSHIKDKMFELTMDGIIYTVEHLGGWLQSWGSMPESKEERVEIAKKNVKLNPMFIPICANRFLSICPTKIGNPVYSINGSDVICYGKDFWDFCKRNYPDFHEEVFPTIDLKSIKEPIPQYNKFVYHSINNFFYHAKDSNEHGN